MKFAQNIRQKLKQNTGSAWLCPAHGVPAPCAPLLAETGPADGLHCGPGQLSPRTALACPRPAERAPACPWPSDAIRRPRVQFAPTKTVCGATEGNFSLSPLAARSLVRSATATRVSSPAAPPASRQRRRTPLRRASPFCCPSPSLLLPPPPVAERKGLGCTLYR